jgi:DNA helicase-2/ATP-dependent DNA helicase PcrA
MVDEYQDTNTAQYRLIRLLADRYRNLCVVGDDDQSIYRFRGANIRNILDFEKDFPDALVIRLEQNYRSTGHILAAANEVIAHNESRKEKRLWTDQGDGEKLTLIQAWNDEEEAEIIDRQIQKLKEQGESYQNIALLYRTNAQSRVLEERLVLHNIPYRLYGGTPFYQRKEIKDILCYLRLIANDHDYVAAGRIINVPTRGIGDVTWEKLRELAVGEERGVCETIQDETVRTVLARAAKKLTLFAEQMAVWREEKTTYGLKDLIEQILEDIDYEGYLLKDDDGKVEERKENIEELKNRAVQYEEGNEEPSLEGFLEELTLVAAIDTYEEDVEAVSLMTLHSAKGLEFPVVFLTGLEDGTFPSYQSIINEESDPESMAEERRLCYVGITRAKKKLYLSYAKNRRVQGREQMMKPSRFLEEIPSERIEELPAEASAKAGFGRRTSLVHEDEGEYGNYRSHAAAEPVDNPYLKKQSSIQPPAAEEVGFRPGDTVMHKTFGLGVIKDVKWMNADYQVRVDFVKVGEKLLFAKLAGIKKV